MDGDELRGRNRLSDVAPPLMDQKGEEEEGMNTEVEHNIQVRHELLQQL